jgi:PDZ domain-containing protein
MSAPHETAVGVPHETGQDPRRLSRRSTMVLVGVFLGIAAASLLSMLSLPFAVLQPGPVSDTLGAAPDGKPLISISGATTHKTSGSLHFTTVRVLGGPADRVDVWEVLLAALDPSSEVVPEEAVFPQGVTSEEVEEQSAAQMAGSQQEAVAVALRALGKAVPERVAIAAVSEDAPSAALLREGDEIVAVDSVPTPTAEAVRDAIQRHRPGDEVTLTLRRDGSSVQVRADTREADGRAVIGVMLESRFDFPVTVEISAGEVGGPSAGLMFALGIYDKLTPGALTGGHHVAGTGSVDSDGGVGSIGGIRQKLVGARDGGARFFLAPADNCDEVVGHVPDGLQVVRVATFEEARKAVERIAAKDTAGLPACG